MNNLVSSEPYVHFAPTHEQSFPYYIWSYTPNTTLLEFIDKCHDRNKEVKIICTTEPTAAITPGKTLEDLDGNWDSTKVDIIYGSHGGYPYEQKFFEEEDMFRVMKPNRYFFPLYFLYHTFYQYSFEYRTPPNITYRPDAYFTCYNRQARAHRLILLEHLNQKGLLKYNYYSLVYYDYNIEMYKKSYKFDFKNLTVPQKDLEKKDDINRSYYTLSSSFLNSAFQLVTETTDDQIFLTEKTFYPILAKKPFLIFGAQHTNKVLEKFGFKLYRDVFNYDFDDIEDTEERSKAIVEEVERVVDTYFPSELYQKLKPTAEHNYKVALDILQNKKFIPTKFKEWEEEYKDNSIWRNHIASWYYNYSTNLNSYVKEITKVSKGSMGEQAQAKAF